jgi:predicted AAA+ superfamily ATPase
MIRGRDAEPLLKRLAGQYPVVTVTGPRQSGKTTLCRKVFPKKPYVSLETPDVRRRVVTDPRSFLDDLPDGAILDEFQRTPELLSHLQERVDTDARPGRFILTGSAQIERMEGVSQSLAGRTALLRLLPFSYHEAYPSGKPAIESMLQTGFFPRIFDKKLDPTEALSFYTATYVERDVRSLMNIKDLGKFDQFLRMCAARTSQLTNFSALGNDLGMNYNTIAQWISLLETSFLVYRLRPHAKNFGKRLVKTPKLHFLDCGLAAFLMEITQPSHLKTHPARGALFESYVTAELLKGRYALGLPAPLYFWRDNTGNEIDLLWDFGEVLFPIEVKSSKTVTDDFLKGLDFFRRINPKCKKAAVVYGGDKTYSEGDTWMVSFRDLPRLAALDHRLRF